MKLLIQLVREIIYLSGKSQRKSGNFKTIFFYSTLTGKILVVWVGRCLQELLVELYSVFSDFYLLS